MKPADVSLPNFPSPIVNPTTRSPSVATKRFRGLVDKSEFGYLGVPVSVDRDGLIKAYVAKLDYDLEVTWFICLMVIS